MRLSYVLSLLVLSVGCGDIIKTKDPRPGRKPYQPATLTDQTGSCPYYPAVWNGRCTGQGHDLSRTIPLDVAQTGCTLFALNSVSVYSITEDKNIQQGEKSVKSRAKWLNEERTALELKEEWIDAGRTLQRTVTFDATKGEAVEKLRQTSSDGASSDLHSCMYQRS